MIVASYSENEYGGVAYDRAATVMVNIRYFSGKLATGSWII